MTQSQTLDHKQLPSSGGAFGFTYTPPEALTSTRYTVVTILGDRSGSTGDQLDRNRPDSDMYIDLVPSTVKSIYAACKKMGLGSHLLVRLATFSTVGTSEVHGFTPLLQLDECDSPAWRKGIRAATWDRSDPCPYAAGSQEAAEWEAGKGFGFHFIPRGSTPLYEATLQAVEAMNTYAADLRQQDYDVNGALFILTDGAETETPESARPAKIGEIHSAITRATTGETMESLHSVLIGFNADTVGGYSRRTNAELLGEFAKGIGLSQFVDIGKATPDQLAKLARFVSASVSSQSQALGTGGPSQALKF